MSDDLATRVSQGNTRVDKLVSGLTVEYRKVVGIDRDLWTSKANRHRLLTTLFDQIVLKVVDPGPYAEAVYVPDLRPKERVKVFDNGKLDWRYVLRGDRMDLLMRFRASSYPDLPYTFPQRCTTCGRLQDLHVDLLNDFALQPLADCDRQTFMSGNRFEERLHECGRMAYYKIEVGADEERLMKMVADGQIGEQNETKPLRLQVLEIEGVPVQDTLRFVQHQMTGADQDQLLDAMDRHDCGYNTQVIRRCERCRAEMVVTPPFLDRGFLVPATAVRSRRMAAIRGQAGG